MPAQTPAADPFPSTFDALEVFEMMAEVAIDAGAEAPALKALLARIRELTADE